MDPYDPTLSIGIPASPPPFDPYVQNPIPGPPGSGQMGVIPSGDPLADPFAGGMGMGIDPMTGMPMDPMMMDPMAQPVDPVGMLSPISQVPPEPQVGPVWPSWYRKPKRPVPDEIRAEAEEEKRAHAGRIAIAMEMRKRLNMDVYGHFAEDEEAIQSGQIPPAWVTALRDEHDLAASHGSSMDWAVDAVNRQTIIDREEMNAKEDLAAYLFECEQRQHSRSGYANIKWALFDTLMAYGMLVGFDAIDPSDDECGLHMRLVDPATCFPIHEGKRGLARMYRCYYATATSVIGDFDDAGGNVARKVRRIARGDNKTYDPNYMGEVIEYWDRHWVCVLFDGETVLLKAHAYARVPFTVTYGCFGQQGFTRSSDNYYVNGSTVVYSAGAASSAMRQEDLMRTAQPFLWRRVKAHDMEEAVSGLIVSAFRRSINPPVIHYRSILSIGQGRPEIDRSEGGYTPAGEDDKFEAFPTIPSPEIINPLIAYLQQNRITGMPSGVLSGQMPSSQTSGNAIDILGSMGFQRWNPLIMCVEQFLTERTEWRLELIRDWGDVIGSEGSLGTLTVPRRKPNPRTGDASAHEVTPELLRSTGIRVKVELRRFDPSTLSQLANGLMVLRSMGIIDKRRSIKIAGFDPDPDAVIQDIDWDELNEVPEIKQEKALRTFKKLADQAKARGDYESAIDIEQALYFIASMMEQRMSIGQPALGPDGQRLRPIGGGGGNPNMQVQGLSNPMMGMGIGQMGGAPGGM